MTAFWDVSILVLVLVGIALFVIGTVVGVGVQIGNWVKKMPPWRLGAVAAVFGVLGLVLAYLLRHHASLAWAGGEQKSESLTAIATVSGDVITAILAATTLYAVILLRRAVSEQNRQLKASVVQNIGNEMLKIDKWTAKHPEYLKAIELPEGEKSEHGEAIAEIYADFIDQVVSQEEYLPDGHFPLWEEYFDDIIVAWPQLRKYMVEHREWYLDTMNQLLDRDPSPLVTGIPAVCIPVTDYKSALKFYTNRLGMKKLLDITHSQDERWVTLVAPGSATRVALMPSRPEFSSGATGIRLATSDAAAAHKRLSDCKDVTVKDLQRSLCRPPMFTFSDPEGNWLEITQEKRRRVRRHAKRLIVGMPAVCIPVTDHVRAVDFYTQTLGMERLRHLPCSQNRRCVSVAPADSSTRIVLMATHSGHSADIRTGIRLTTADAEAAHQQLCECEDVTVYELQRSEDLRPMFSFLDPAGNKLTIIQMATRSLTSKGPLPPTQATRPSG